MKARWPYLRRAVLAQSMDDEGRQPFSGDETFRTAMSATMGLGLGISYGDDYWSSNSSFLMIAAAEWMAYAAQKVGEPGDAEILRERAARARAGLMKHFVLPGGYFAPFIDRATQIAETRPFEDVALKPLCTGAFEPDDPIVLSNLERLHASAGRGDGTVQSPLDPEYYDYLGLEISEGIGTGMVAGYYLHYLTAIGARDAEAAFNALHRYADPGGQFDEYVVYDDLSALSPIYDTHGTIGDYAARYRPWEGGINLDAFLYYLLGTTLHRDGTVSLRPHLPNGLPSIDIAGLHAGLARGRLSLERTATSLALRFTSTATASFTLQVDLPVPKDVTEVESDGRLTTLPAGERVMRFDAVSLKPGATLERSLAITD